MSRAGALLVAACVVTHFATITEGGARQATSPAGPAKARPVFTAEPAFTADVSPDGRLAVVFTQPFGRGTKETPARVEIRDLTTRTTTVLQGGTSVAGTPGLPAAVFSPDGRQVVYSWLDEKLTDTGMLQVIGVGSGSVPRTLIPAEPSDIGIVPHGWSPDGKSILVLIHGPSDRITSDPTSIAWVSVADGALRVIKKLEPWQGGVDALPRLSPDGRWIAYAGVTQNGSPERQIHVMSADGQSDRIVSPIDGTSTFPVWTPDSSSVVFRNVQGDRSSLVAVSIAAGSAAGAPWQLGGFVAQPIRIDASGALFYRSFGGGTIGIIAERTPGGGRFVEEFSGYGATWVENTLAYIRADRELIVRSLDSGNERTYQYTFLPLFPPRVLRDRSAAVVYLFPGADGGRPGGSFYRVDFKSGTFARLFGKDTAEHSRSNLGVLSHDNRSLYLGVLAQGQQHWTKLVSVDLATGVEKALLSIPAPGLAVAGMALSPDGATLALHAVDGRIITTRLDGSDYREVQGPSAGGGWRDVMRWSPDGRLIIFATRLTPTSNSWRLLQVPPAGGKAEDYGLRSSVLPQEGQLTSIDTSPDNSRIALGLRTRPTFDVAVLDGIGQNRRP